MAGKFWPIVLLYATLTSAEWELLSRLLSGRRCFSSGTLLTIPSSSLARFYHFAPAFFLNLFVYLFAIAPAALIKSASRCSPPLCPLSAQTSLQSETRTRPPFWPYRWRAASFSSSSWWRASLLAEGEVTHAKIWSRDRTRCCPFFASEKMWIHRLDA